LLTEHAQDLPPHVLLVLQAIADALGNQALTPEIIAAAAPQFEACIPGHIVQIEHVPRPDKGTRPRLKAVYTVAIRGAQFDGRWHFNPTQLNELLKKAVRLSDLP
jgi:hypothetical protein